MTTWVQSRCALSASVPVGGVGDCNMERYFARKIGVGGGAGQVQAGQGQVVQDGALGVVHPLSVYSGTDGKVVAEIWERAGGQQEIVKVDGGAEVSESIRASRGLGMYASAGLVLMALPRANHKVVVQALTQAAKVWEGCKAGKIANAAALVRFLKADVIDARPDDSTGRA